MSLQLPKEYGSVSEEVVDEFKELNFEFFEEGGEVGGEWEQEAQ